MSRKILSLPFHTENAIAAIRDAVTALRQRGLKSEHALADLASDLGIARKRVHTLFYRDGEPIVLADEWGELSWRIARVLRHEAETLRERADEYEARADTLENQLSLWDVPAWNQNGSGLRQRSAA